MRSHCQHRKLPAARHLKQVQITVAVSGMERFNPGCNQEITLFAGANALASCRMAHSFHLMQWV
jgi:hypothetical protein